MLLSNQPKRKINGLECILLIDDDEDDSFVTKRIIERTIEVKVCTVRNGIEALDYLTQKGRYANNVAALRPDLIFLDINMPLMNGWGFLEEYQKLPTELKEGIVVRMLSTSYNPYDADKARTYADLAGFLHKPLTSLKLSNILELHFEAGGAPKMSCQLAG